MALSKRLREWLEGEIQVREDNYSAPISKEDRVFCIQTTVDFLEQGEYYDELTDREIDQILPVARELLKKAQKGK